jgi:beta-lactamase regulating signal transducer with metallopeptidase domain
MKEALSLLWMLACVSASSWMLSQIAVALMSRLSAPGSLAPLARRLWLLASMPLLAVTLPSGALLALATAKQQSWVHDHCHHEHLHAHFCLEHLPHLMVPVALWCAVLLLALVACLRLTRCCNALWITHSRQASLKQLAQAHKGLHIWRNDIPQAFVAGLWHPAIFVSDALFKNVTKRQQRLIIAHETAHARHGDPLKHAFFQILLCFHTPITATILQHRWCMLMEMRADEYAATRFSPHEVAMTLLTLARYPMTPHRSPSATGACIQERIQHLLSPRRAGSSPLGDLVISTALLSAPVVTAFQHHAIETLLGWTLR